MRRSGATRRHLRPATWPGTALVGAVLLLAAAPAVPQQPLQWQGTAVADATIFHLPGSTTYDAVADGQGPNLWTSVIAGGVVRRALVRFDLAGLPAGAVITDAALSLTQIRARDSHVVAVHRVVAAWGEGTANGGDAGVGAPAQPGDSTWTRRIWAATSWSQPGGDFLASASATQLIPLGTGRFSWPSTPALVADVQAWLDQPAGNHGWLLIGVETVDQNAKRFASREAGANAAPRLVLQYTLPQPAEGDVPLPPWALALLGAGLLWRVMARRG